MSITEEEVEYEPAPKIWPALADDVLDMLTREQLRQQAVRYVADHGWDAYSRGILRRLTAWTHRPGCSRRQISQDAQKVRYSG